jgi:tryptophan halogenase
MRQRFRQEHQPDSLAQRIALFKDYAHAYQADGELFRVDSWSQVMFGQGIMPERYHQSTRAMKEKDLTQFLSTLRTNISQAVAQLPSHQEFVNQYCKAGSAA